MSSDELQAALEAIASVMSAGGAMPGTAGTVSKIGAIAFSSAAALVNSGLDPVAEIERIHSSDPVVKSVREEWANAMDAKFGKGSGT